jgi:menaquinol-cytochrome c reductase iron-sulfur subunit
VEADQAVSGNSEVDGAIGAIHEHGHGDDGGLAIANDLNGLLDPAAFGNDVLHDEAALAWSQLKPSSEHETAFLLLSKDEPASQLAGDLLANDESAHRRCDDGLDFQRAHPVCKGGAESLDDGHLLEGQGALEELPAMESAAQDEVAFEQCTGAAKEVEGFRRCHRAEARRGVGGNKDGLGIVDPNGLLGVQNCSAGLQFRSFDSIRCGVFRIMCSEKSVAPPDRRGFFKQSAALVIGAMAGLVPLGAGLFAWLDPLRRHSGTAGFLKVASLESLPPDSVPRKFPVLADRVDAWTRTPAVPIGAVYLRRTAERVVVALHVSCPHAGCFVDYQSARKGYYCPCHDSTFAEDGSVNDPKSPSPRALDSLEVELRGSEIWVRFQNFQAGHKEKRVVA